MNSRTNAALRLRVQVCDEVMAARGIKSVAALARAARMSKSQLFRLRSGECGASLRTALRLAAVGKTSINKLFEDPAMAGELP